MGGAAGATTGATSPNATRPFVRPRTVTGAADTDRRACRGGATGGGMGAASGTVASVFSLSTTCFAFSVVEIVPGLSSWDMAVMRVGI